jgi:hypothetical protein
MLSPQALFRGLVSRILPSPNPDSQQIDVGSRFGRYGENAVLSYIRKSHLLADEGSYFTANNAQTGVAITATAAFTATNPALLIQNQDSSGGRRIYLDYLLMVTTAAGSFASGGVNLQMMIYTDSTLRYSSAGTALTPVSTNQDLGYVKSIASVYFGAVVATAASALARAICGLRILRPTVATNVADVVGELKFINFGGVEQPLNGSITIANANQIPHPAPPVVIGPGQSALVYVVMNGTTPVASSYAPEISWWER